MNTDFLKSNRFWAAVIGALVKVLSTEGVIPASVADAIIALIVAFIGVRTVDRFGEKVGQ